MSCAILSKHFSYSQLFANELKIIESNYHKTTYLGITSHFQWLDRLADRQFSTLNKMNASTCNDISGCKLRAMLTKIMIKIKTFLKQKNISINDVNTSTDRWSLRIFQSHGRIISFWRRFCYIVNNIESLTNAQLHKQKSTKKKPV